jgi:VanZ family protein
VKVSPLRGALSPSQAASPVESRTPAEIVSNRHPTLLVRASWLAVILWACAIYYLSSLSGPQIAKIGIRLWDKAAHFLAFFSGSVALTCALRFSTGWSWVRIGFIGALAIAGYGATDEYHQIYTPNRSGGDLLDWLADALGGTFGTAFTIVIYVRLERSNRPAPAGN